MFQDMTADMESNKTLSPIVTELYIRGKKLNISLVFRSQSFYKVPKTIRLNATHYFIMKMNDTTLPSDNPLKFRNNLL